MTCGIYCITNLINGKQYVGQSINIEERFRQHICADNGSKIHKAIAKYGEHNFRFEPLIRCSPEELDEQEVKFIRLLGSYENGYNQTRGGQHSVFDVEYNYHKYSELKQELKNKKDKISSLKKDNKELKTKINKLYDEIKDLEKERDSLSTKNLLLSKQIKQMKKNVIKLREKITDFKKGNGIFFNKEWKSLQNKNERLNSKIRLLESENIELKFENEKLLRKNSYPNSNVETNIFQQILNEEVFDGV